MQQTQPYTMPLADWENPEVFAVNKEPARASFFSFWQDPKEFVSQPWQQKNYLSLNGQWKFHYSTTPQARADGFHRVDYPTDHWDEIAVPANWQLQGYGVANYINMGLDFTDSPVVGEIPKESNPVGAYKRTFDLPEEWQGRQVFVYLGAVKSAFHLWVNGKEVGYSQDSKSPAEFDISPYLQPGMNQIAVQVYRWSDGTYLELQDMWRLSGIERDVYLYATPKVRIRDFHANATLDEHYQGGLLDFSAVIKNQQISPQSGYKLQIRLRDHNLKVLMDKELSLPQIAVAGEASLNFMQAIAPIKHWSAESPHLYNLHLALINEEGQAIQHIHSRVGFRSSELKNGNILINGQPVLFKGVNRHEHDPYSGHVISRESMYKDMALLKQFNVNALRTAHYPNDPYWYELADEYGMYIVDEANIESHGLGAANQGGSYDPATHPVNMANWREAYINRVENLYERDKNHPSVVIWSIGNESGDGPNIEALYDWLKAKSPMPVMSEQAQLRRHTDMYSQMYASVEVLEHYALLHAAGGESRPLILCEYEHTMGNSGGNLAEYWQLFEKYPALQGGFIWDWVDQTFALKNADGEQYWGYGGDMELPGMYHDGNFSANGVMAADRSPNPHAFEVKGVYQDMDVVAADLLQGKVRVRNKRFFADLSDVSLRWRIEGNGQLVIQGRLKQMQVAPQSSEIINLDWQFEAQANTEYFINFDFVSIGATEMLPAGYLRASSQLPLANKVIASLSPPVSRLAKLKVNQDDKHLVVKGNDVSVAFDLGSGWLSDYSLQTKSILVEAMRPEFWRAPTDNDFGEGFAETAKVWKLAGQNTVLKILDWKQLANAQVEVRTEHYFPDLQSRYLSHYLIEEDGSITVDLWFYAAPHQFQSALPRIGSLLQIPAEFDQVEWFGRGPHENYWDRKTSALVGLYQKTVDELYFPYVRPQENGYRSDVRRVSFSNQQGLGLEFIGLPLLGFGAQRFDVHDYDQFSKSGKHPHDLAAKDRIFINIDYKQRGVAGTDSWGSSPLFKYTLPWRDYHYGFVIKPRY
jgi:beta-galactosidase